MMEVEEGALYIRRQLFEHSMQVPLLLVSMLSEQMDPKQLLTPELMGTAANGTPFISRSAFKKATEGWMPKAPVDWSDIMLASVLTSFPGAVLSVNEELRDIAPEGWSCPMIDLNAFTSDLDVKLPLPEMVTYLWLQMSSKRLASTYRRSADAHWPEEPGTMSPLSPETDNLIDRKRSQAGASPVLKATAVHDLNREMMLIVENINTLLQLIAKSYGADQEPSEILLSRKHIDHLSYVLTAGVDSQGRALPLSEAVPSWKAATEATLPLPKVAKDIISLLKRPKVEPTSPEIYEVEGLEKKTLLKSGTPASQLKGRDVRVVKCSDSYVYLLNAVNRISINGCIDCTIFVGAATSLSIIGCGRVKVISTCRNCRISNCVDTTVFLCTNQVTQVLGDTRAIVIAPYNASYENFDRDAALVNVDPAENRWDQFYTPLSFASPSPAGTSNAPPGGGVPANVVTLLPPEKFFPFVVPVAKEGDTPVVSSAVTPAPQAAPLPEEYAKIIQKRTAEVDAMRKAVRSAQAKYAEDNAQNGGTGPDLQSVVQEYFREWLISSGNLRQINDLMRLEEEFNNNGKK